MKRQISTQTARRLFVRRQRLSGPRPAANADNLFDIFQSLGCIQIDPLKPVAETQRLVAYSRLGPHDQSLFHELQAERKTIFEYWAHAASFVLAEHFPIHSHYFARPQTTNSKWQRTVNEWVTANTNFQKFILSELRERGPLQPKDIEDRPDVPSLQSTWSSNRSVTNLIHHMWMDGKVGVAYRQGTRKYWDLMERCVPDGVALPEISPEEMVKQGVLVALSALGVGTVPHIRNHFIRGRYRNIRPVLETLEADGLIEQVEISDSPEWQAPGPWYLPTSLISELNQIDDGHFEPRTVLLSPFDNLICDRERTELMFNYEFRVEIYVPKAKRQYGYYVLSLLDGDRIIGRVDPKMDRKTGTLMIQAVFQEPKSGRKRDFQRKLKTELESLAELAGAKAIEYTAPPA